jgi:hypothetical protein
LESQAKSSLGARYHPADATGKETPMTQNIIKGLLVALMLAAAASIVLLLLRQAHVIG